jgi:hypothetical protein
MASESRQSYPGGCLCGALRYEAEGEPLFAGHCYCADCRKASGSGFVPFMGFSRDAVRNSCPVCGSLVFGGVGKSEAFTIYTGTLDDPSLFHPTVAIFTLHRPSWAAIPPGLKIFEKAY